MLYYLCQMTSDKKGEQMKYTIEQVRKLCGISQKQMAEDIDMALPTYIKKEKGETEFYLSEAYDVVEVACDKYGLDIYLSDIEPRPKSRM